MAWPPAALPSDRTNSTPMTDVHPADHNAYARAINDTVSKVAAIDPVVTALATRGGYIATSSGIAYTNGFYGKIGPLVDSVNVGSALQNTSPTVTVLKAGAYAVTALLNAGAGITGGMCDLLLVAQPGGSYAVSFLPVTKQLVSVCAVRHFDVNDTISVEFYNGAGPLTPFVTLMIERVSP